MDHLLCSIKARQHTDTLITLADKGYMRAEECSRLHDNYRRTASFIAKALESETDECRVAWLQYQYDRHHEIADAMMAALCRMGE